MSAIRIVLYKISVDEMSVDEVSDYPCYSLQREIPYQADLVD